MYKRDIRQVKKAFFKGGMLSECVVDSEGNVIAIVGEDSVLADFIAGCLNCSDEYEFIEFTRTNAYQCINK